MSDRYDNSEKCPECGCEGVVHVKESDNPYSKDKYFDREVQGVGGDLRYAHFNRLTGKYTITCKNGHTFES
jgi:hypothetical protein